MWADLWFSIPNDDNFKVLGMKWKWKFNWEEEMDATVGVNKYVYPYRVLGGIN